ncbi:MAG: ABC transporter ATP-binding protein [Actinomycetales bacterium]|nr:ABC transporter ATP-binding protein [Actinomycetales bacterium]
MTTTPATTPATSPGRTERVGSSEAAVVDVRDVRRTFGSTVALDGVSLTVEPGQLVGLLGPNGAGKTTLLSLLSGLRRPDSGTVRIFGGDPRDPASRASLGTTPQETGLPEPLRVSEVVDLVSRHFPDPMPAGELLERFGLGDLTRRQTGSLSGGQKRRLAVALALVGRPQLVLLDEPTTGLDVEARHELWTALRSFHSDGATVLVTSHYLEEIEALAERVVVVGQGRILADDSLSRVLATVARRKVLVRLPDPAAAQALSTALPTVSDPASEGDRFAFLAADADELVRHLVRTDTPFSDLEVRGASLEEAFITLTKESR